MNQLLFDKDRKQLARLLVYAGLHCDNPINLFQNFTCFHLNVNWQSTLPNSPYSKLSAVECLSDTPKIYL